MAYGPINMPPDTHIDHINALPMLLRTPSDPAVFVPREHLNEVREFTRMSWGIKGEDGTERAGTRIDVAVPAVAADIASAEEAGTRDVVPDAAASHGALGRLWVAAVAGMRVRLPGKSNIVCECIRCFHTLADVGYVLSETAIELCGVDSASQREFDRLKESAKLGDKKAGREIGVMRKRGELQTVERLVPKLAFLCDTT